MRWFRTTGYRGVLRSNRAPRRSGHILSIIVDSLLGAGPIFMAWRAGIPWTPPFPVIWSPPLSTCCSWTRGTRSSRWAASGSCAAGRDHPASPGRDPPHRDGELSSDVFLRLEPRPHRRAYPDPHIERKRAGSVEGCSFRLTAFCVSSGRMSAAAREYRLSSPQEPGEAALRGLVEKKCWPRHDRRSSCLPGGSETRV